MKKTRIPILLICAALVFALVGCGGPQGRIKAESEGSLVGSRTAGAATYNKLVAETVEKLLSQHRARALREGDRKLICFVEIENKSAEELAENKEALYEEIDTIIVNSYVYSSVSRRFVNAALRNTGLRADELFLAKGRKQFMSVLGESGITPDYLLWGTVTTLSTMGSYVKEREYMLTMEMVDAHTGLTEAKQTAKVRKEYE